MKEKYIVVLCTCPNDLVASQLAQALVEEGLAGCVNRLPRMTSTYRWEGKLKVDSESLLIIKTAQRMYERVAQRIVELHPYELPELIALPIETGSERYLDWLGQNLAR